MMAGSTYAWGYSSWACGWHGTTAVVYHGGAYYGNSAWHGGYYGSSASAYGAYGGSAHASTGYNPSTGTYARGATASNGYGSVSAGQAYNPHTGASASTVQGSNAYGSYGASTASKNGTTVDSQHQTNANGTTAQVHSSTGASAYGATGKNGNSAAIRRNRKWRQVRRGKRQNLQQYRQRLGPEERKSIKLQQVQLQRLGFAGTQQWVFGYEQWWRRMEFAGFQCARFVKLSIAGDHNASAQTQSSSILAC